MIIIGITGGVGSGKSALISKIKEEYSTHILLADDVAKELEKKGQICHTRLVNLLGEDILDDDGEIDKARMSQTVFEHPDLLKQVNEIIHPEVKKYILEDIRTAREQGQVLIYLLEAALLIECGYKSIVDEMWYVFASEDVRIKRLKAARGYSDDKIKAIMKSQLSEEEFRKNCDFVVDNSYDIVDSMNQINKRLGILFKD